MRRALRRLGLVSLVTIGLVVAAVSNAEAQGRTMGKVTDEWDNGLEGATVLAEPEGTGSGGPQTTTADDKGEFMFIGLARGNWSFTATIEGYQGVRLVSPISQLSANRPIEFELPALASGGRFRDRTEFEAEGGTPKFRFEDDGTFEFEDADGEGEGTYGMVEQSAILVVRDYDGPDDKFNIATPVIVPFGDAMFSSMTYEGATLSQQ